MTFYYCAKFLPSLLRLSVLGPVLYLVFYSSSTSSGSVVKDSRASSATPRDFCRWETFNATCISGHVILMTSARYGRMHFGRCTTMDAYIGCSIDALSHLDSRCSGRSHCLLAVPDPELHELQPCPKDLSSYLEAEYECIKVQQSAGPHICRSPMSVHRVLNPDLGYLSSHLPSGDPSLPHHLSPGSGPPRTPSSSLSTSCPWLILVEKNQRINLTLFDFGLVRSDSEDVDGREPGVCMVYATIEETGRREETVCGGVERVRRIYTSNNHEVRVTIVRHDDVMTATRRVGGGTGGGSQGGGGGGSGVHATSSRFLIKYESVGCADLAWTRWRTFERSSGDDTASITCNETGQVWHVVCRGKQWVGQIDNCTSAPYGDVPVGYDKVHKVSDAFPFGLLISILIGVILGIFTGGCLLTTVLICRQKSPEMRRRFVSSPHATGVPPGDCDKRQYQLRLQQQQQQQQLLLRQQQSDQLLLPICTTDGVQCDCTYTRYRLETNTMTGGGENTGGGTRGGGGDGNMDITADCRTDDFTGGEGFGEGGGSRGVPQSGEVMRGGMFFHPGTTGRHFYESPCPGMGGVANQCPGGYGAELHGTVYSTRIVDCGIRSNTDTALYNEVASSTE